jgi:hypothetical protein
MLKMTVYLDASHYLALKRIASRDCRAPADLVREAVAEYAIRHLPRTRPKSVGAFTSGRHDLGEHAEELLAGIGADRGGSEPAKRATPAKMGRRR